MLQVLRIPSRLSIKRDTHTTPLQWTTIRNARKFYTELTQFCKSMLATSHSRPDPRNAAIYETFLRLNQKVATDILTQWIKGGSIAGISQDTIRKLVGIIPKCIFPLAKQAPLSTASITRRYPNYEELMQSLIGECDSLRSVGTESSLALGAISSRYINEGLVAALQCVRKRIDQFPEETRLVIYKEIDHTLPKYGQYNHYYNKSLIAERGGVIGYLERPVTCARRLRGLKIDHAPFRNNVALLHDLMNYFIDPAKLLYQSFDLDSSEGQARAEQLVRKGRLRKSRRDDEDEDRLIYGDFKYTFHKGRLANYHLGEVDTVSFVKDGRLLTFQSKKHPKEKLRTTEGSGAFNDDPTFQNASIQYQRLAKEGDREYRTDRETWVTVVEQQRIAYHPRHGVGTPNEGSLFIESARKHGMALWASHSYTAHRMLQFIRWAKGDMDKPCGFVGGIEYEAVAWGIFAFWNQYYYHFISPIHRFHGVMDMAKNYDVPYTPFRYPKQVPELGKSGAVTRGLGTRWPSVGKRISTISTVSSAPSDQKSSILSELKSQAPIRNGLGPGQPYVIGPGNMLDSPLVSTRLRVFFDDLNQKDGSFNHQMERDPPMTHNVAVGRVPNVLMATNRVGMWIRTRVQTICHQMTPPQKKIWEKSGVKP